MKYTRAFIRELLILINRNVGPLSPEVQELYYKADEEMKEVENVNKSKYQVEKEIYDFSEDDEDEPFKWDGKGV